MDRRPLKPVAEKNLDVSIRRQRRSFAALFIMFMLLGLVGNGLAEKKPLEDTFPNVPTPAGAGGSPSYPLMDWMFLEVELKGTIRSVDKGFVFIHLPERYLPKKGVKAEVFRPTANGSLKSVGIVRIEEVDGDLIKGIIDNASKIFAKDIVMIMASWGRSSIADTKILTLRLAL
ncbi:MAG: hypothetical protein GX751_10390 [Desulfuromonadaceae bacterium]|nr:hypothetical protein [Desulfuromonadaceae bacterium]